MTSLIQGKSSIQEFYQSVYKHLSLILNKLGGLEASNESITLLTQAFRDEALETFIRGFNGDLPKLLGMREPADLPQALHLCLKLENQTYRANYAQNSNINSRRTSFHGLSPPLPPRNFPRPQQHRYNQMAFYPQLAHTPQPPYTPPQFNNPQQVTNTKNPNTPPPKPNFPKPQPRPEPMEIDETLRTRRIDYMNRPRPNYIPNRPPPSINQPQQKIQRTFHLNTDNVEYEAAFEEENQELDQSFEDYIASTKEPQLLEEEPLEFSDIHFLEC